MNEIVEKEKLKIEVETLENKIKIEDMIYDINGKQIMLDSDLAILYRCKNGTKEINQAVRNNPDKFPENLVKKKSTFLRSKMLTSKKGVVVEDIPLEYSQNKELPC